jgi:hypothetical protein
MAQDFISALFGAPPDYSNALTPQQTDQMRSNALTQGGIGALIALLGSSGQTARPVSTGQALAGALGAGFGGYQSSFDNTLKQLLTAQQLGEAKRKQERQALFEKAMAGATTMQPQQIPMATSAGSQLEMLSRPEFGGDMAATETGGALRANLPTSPALDFDKLLQAIAIVDPVEAAKLMVPKDTKISGSVGEFMEAKRLGVIPETMSFEKFKGLGKGPLVQNILGGDKLTPGQESIDKKFADDYVAWRGGGGQDMTAQIAQLQPVIQALEAGQPITGMKVAVQPDLLLAMTNPQALQSREQVEEVVQRNLRAVLGAQFTEKEGERLIARAYNPKLPPEENAKRVRRLFLQMSTAAEQKQAMVDYFDQNGTLRGFSGKMPSVQDFYRAMEGETATLTIQDQAKTILEQRRNR